ncbi:phosphoadenosine phosphosulfate reductase family protein [Brevundimonas sp. BR2-1]|uniref:phosphoadenosine phosphosulfate reductase domain-containing protein n=1 Tax=Brevundimonas sp. BR2-1 TaxID=3031123 RepID=UPI00309D7DC1
MQAVLEASGRIQKEVVAGRRWVVAYSGGKDSSLVLKMFWSLSLRGKLSGAQWEVIYCDTGSENPIANRTARRTLERLKLEAAQFGLPVTVSILEPDPSRKLLVRIAGRGYPPPNNFFRWCTKDIRIRPVEEHLRERAQPTDVVVLGVRRGESAQRDRVFSAGEDRFWSKQTEGTSDLTLFLPILDLSVEDVWDGLFWIAEPSAVDGPELWSLYEKASGECPVIKSPIDPPCGGGRFGCWLCTVVRKDKSAENLISNGHAELQPLMDFRAWLLDIRNETSHRCTVRRNGRAALGPFRLSARKEILERLLDAERLSGFELVTGRDHLEISREWDADLCSSTYRED